MIKRILRAVGGRLRQPYRCDRCGPCGWMMAFIGFDVWKKKDGTITMLCRHCSGHRSIWP